MTTVLILITFFLGFSAFDEVECCGIGIIEISSQICCNGLSVDNEFGDNGECCLNTTINKTDTICCQDTPNSIIGIDEPICCGKDNISELKK